MTWTKEFEEEDKKITLELWQRGILAYKYHAAQKIIYKALRALPYTTRRRVVECARGFGKSYLGCAMAVEDCLKAPHTYPVRIIGPELKQTVEIVTPLLEKIAADAPHGLIRRLKAENKWRIGKNELVLGGFNRDYIDRLRGQRAKSIYIEECRDVDSDAYKYGMSDVLAPMCLHSLGVITEMTTPPREEDHWFLLNTVPEAQLQSAYFSYTIYDNPLLNEEQIEIAIKESGGTESETWRREYLCEHFRSLESAVIPQFNRDTHVREFTPPEYLFWQNSIDMGGVQDKTVSLLYYWDFIANTLNVWDERVFDSNTPTTSIVSKCREMEMIHIPGGFDSKLQRTIDAPGQLLVDMNTVHAFNGSIPLKDDFNSQVNLLQVAFGNNRIVVHPRCQFLIASLQNGRLNKQRTDYMRTETLGHCDAIAALSYALRNAKRESPIPLYRPNPQTEWQNPAMMAQSKQTKVAKSLVPSHFKRAK